MMRKAIPAINPRSKDTLAAEKRQSVVRKMCAAVTLLENWATQLFRYDAVGPFDQADENRWVAELCVEVGEICFRDATRPAAGSSRINGDVFGTQFFQRFV